jgi:hypothetical protein
MEYVTKPLGAKLENILEIENIFNVTLPNEMHDWWVKSDGPDVYFGFKELQFFSVKEILGEDIYQLRKYMPNSIPLCMDGNGNICVAKVLSGQIAGFYVADCGDLGWDEAKFISITFPDFINDQYSPEERLNANRVAGGI